LFDWLKKKRVSQFDFSAIGTDMHSHIIPGIDDGAKNLEVSLALASRFVDLGFSKLIATPHIMADYFRNTPITIQKGLDTLRDGLQKAALNLEVEMAAEYYLDETFENKIAKKEVLTFGKEKFVLFELSYINKPPYVLNIIDKMQHAGYQPVLAHPERYPYYYHSIDNYLTIKDKGCLLQLNTISLTGYYGKGAKQVAEQLINESCIDFIGSDMHHLRHADALKQSLSLERLETLLSQPQLKNSSL
jgi:protein-tyrosine phosphatase